MDQPMPQPMTREQRRAYNRQRHALTRQQAQAARGPRGLAELWWDEARRIAREHAANGDETAWNDLSTTLKHFSDRYGR
ncbi:hypothetical protein [Streptomyces sp. GSL17-111]|uniref:hypothetical protein n=1 Tax=Streptomyces sp. GSL17-111 TaxID=3121596 RepID=UPI0030F3AEFD